MAIFSKNFRLHTLGRCQTITILFAHINSELVHGLTLTTAFSLQRTTISL
jgi:hypothetical protein